MEGGQIAIPLRRSAAFAAQLIVLPATSVEAQKGHPGPKYALSNNDSVLLVPSMGAVPG
jgi:hypothetical protein